MWRNGWLWAARASGRWWSAGDPASPFVRHAGYWWSRRHGVWFALRDGRAWAWRAFAEWGGSGWWRPEDGASVVYSADWRRAAVIVPGRGATLLDAETGEILGRWEEHELPRRRPRAPSALLWGEGI
jgi:hypothetical protein